MPGHFIVWKKTLQSWRIFSVTAASIQHVSTSCPPAQNTAVGWSGWDCWPCLQHNFSYVVNAAGLQVCDFCKYTESPPKTGAKRRANENSLFIGGAYCAVLTIFWGVSPQKSDAKTASSTCKQSRNMIELFANAIAEHFCRESTTYEKLCCTEASASI